MDANKFRGVPSFYDISCLLPLLCTSVNGDENTSASSAVLFAYVSVNAAGHRSPDPTGGDIARVWRHSSHNAVRLSLCWRTHGETWLVKTYIFSLAQNREPSRWQEDNERAGSEPQTAVIMMKMRWRANYPGSDTIREGRPLKARQIFTQKRICVLCWWCLRERLKTYLSIMITQVDETFWDFSTSYQSVLERRSSVDDMASGTVSYAVR